MSVTVGTVEMGVTATRKRVKRMILLTASRISTLSQVVLSVLQWHGLC